MKDLNNNFFRHFRGKSEIYLYQKIMRALKYLIKGKIPLPMIDRLISPLKYKLVMGLILNVAICKIIARGRDII